MQLDPEICFRAVSSRDRRFDGKFFIGVKSTRIYCRPVCPARHALRRNMEFYASAAAAENAGFRPCLRCFPEYSPRYVASGNGQEVIARALHLISVGVVDEQGVSGVSQKLGISDRHLRRLFAEQLGASPLAFAQTRRLQFAKQLIADTKLSMTKVAFASGFQSIRQFNGAFRRLYGRAPREIRRSIEANRASEGAGFQMNLAYRPPLDWESLLQFLQPRLLAGIESIEKETYRRLVNFEDAFGVVEISHCPERHSLKLTAPPQLWRFARSIFEQARRLFDLDCDPMVISKHLRSDPFLARIVGSNTGVRVLGGWEPFADAIRIILGQQVSVSAATTLCSRLIQQFGKRHGDSELCRLFPSSTVLANADMTSIGITRSRAKAIQGFSKAVATQVLDFDTAMSLPEFLARAESVPGIGRWTANCIAMRCLKDPNAFPAGDLGIRKAFSNGKQSLISERMVAKHAERWQPWRSYAAMALWQPTCP